MVTIASCKFNKPLVTIPNGKYVTVDTLTQNSIKTKYSLYLSLRNGISIGSISVQKTYNSDNKIISKQIFKQTHAWLKDGNNRYYLKKISYDSIGQTSKVHYKIHQNYGRAGKTVYEKTVDK